jgi:hypothetical protein
LPVTPASLIVVLDVPNHVTDRSDQYVIQVVRLHVAKKLWITCRSLDWSMMWHDVIHPWYMRLAICPPFFGGSISFPLNTEAEDLT